MNFYAIRVSPPKALRLKELDRIPDDFGPGPFVILKTEDNGDIAEASPWITELSSHPVYPPAFSGTSGVSAYQFAPSKRLTHGEAAPVSSRPIKESSHV